MTSTTKVTFASEWTDSKGKTHKGGSTAAVDAADARALVQIGRAQLADADPAADIDVTPQTEKAGKQS